MFYRMYCVKVLGDKPDSEVFKKNAIGRESVEKIEWQYFDAVDVIYNDDGDLPETDAKLYSTMLVRLEKLKEQAFLKNFINIPNL